MPKLPNPYNNIGNALRQIGNFDEAVRNFNKAIEINPNFADAYNNLALTLQKQKKYDQAIGEYVDVALYPFKEWQAKALYELAVVLERKGEPTKARDQFNQLISMYPDTHAAKVAKEQLK